MYTSLQCQLLDDPPIFTRTVFVPHHIPTVVLALRCTGACMTLPTCVKYVFNGGQVILITWAIHGQAAYKLHAGLQINEIKRLRSAAHDRWLQRLEDDQQLKVGWRLLQQFRGHLCLRQRISRVLLQRGTSLSCFVTSVYEHPRHEKAGEWMYGRHGAESTKPIPLTAPGNPVAVPPAVAVSAGATAADASGSAAASVSLAAPAGLAVSTGCVTAALSPSATGPVDAAPSVAPAPGITTPPVPTAGAGVTAVVAPAAAADKPPPGIRTSSVPAAAAGAAAMVVPVK